ncbi:MAG: ATP-dependent DNA helicase RecG [Armatimonadetes bacterium]|nr:ATP-dependent DNA helicase RecG [Armatimonadota bacterium]
MRALREEYRDGCRDRRGLDRLLLRWKAEVDRLESGQSRAMVAAVRPLLKGYSPLGTGERQHLVVQVGQDLARLTGQQKEAQAAPAGRRPPAERPRLELGGEVKFLKGVGPHMAARLKKLGIQTLEDLLLHVPRRWEDRTRLRPIRDLRDGVFETVKGVLGAPRTKKPRPGLTLIQAPLTDASGTLMLTWFNQPYLAKQLVAGAEVVVCGKVERRFSETQMQNPDLESQEEQGIHTGRVIPVYPLTGAVTQKWLRKLQFRAVPTYAPLLPENLPLALLDRLGFVPRGEAVLEYHWPSSFPALDQARRRLAFEELFMIQVEIAYQRRTRELEPRIHEYRLEQDLKSSFQTLLPFEPTGAQRRVMDEVMGDLERPTPMNRLLQGDVGAGKTVIAAFAAWCAIRNGLQAAIMAPTEILAEQHSQKLKAMLEPAGVSVELLTGSMKKRQKRQVCEALAAGRLQLVVGTHALIQEGVEFARLGMVVVDEQHKFGVMQRTVLRQKGQNPDLLVMTATPIPRTLALTLYGDLEVSRLDELPPGRQPIRSQSVAFTERKQVYELIRREVRAGRQAYIICPLVEETEKVEATAAVEEAEIVRQRVFPEFSIGLLHGRMKADDKERVMEAFRRGEHQILISTTVIEVGVDVPNATVMLVQDANRFGLAQLHQLRGRVGRGAHASHCIFMGDASSQDSYRRLQAIARLSDGFEVAEEDLQIRGPGDYYGLRQSGFPEFRVADLLRDQDLLEIARQAAQHVIRTDPELESPEHRPLADYLELRGVRTAELVH